MTIRFSEFMAALLLTQGGNSSPPQVTPDHFRELTTLVFYLVFVLIAFVFGIFAIRRWAQRYRESTAPRRIKPTSSSDVWSMHQVPAIAEDDDTSDDRGDVEEED